ncbi:uncharacterized protein LOC108111250 [Drosophila eugracilis]|uniref:uncharacterized protein LOC108111250 n=1 Tax=Drosophila eugracilis TaxID=29029 RepID=UPI001BDA6872|nr:uncharacterized protein LOC108111250 [Drosophila eugracilis]
MKLRFILGFATLLAFQNHTHAKKYYNLMGEDEMLHLQEIYKQIDHLTQLNRIQHRNGPAYAFGSNDYLDEKLPGVSSLIDIYKKWEWISRHYNQMRLFEVFEFATITMESMAMAQVATREGENLQAMEDINLILFGKEDLIGHKLPFYKQLSTRTCKTSQSPQQYLYSLYVDYIILELKAHALVEWSWMYLRKRGQSGSTEEELANRGAYKRRTPDTLSKIKDLMSQADRTVWRCDPKRHLSGITYEEVTRLLQGYVVNEVDLNSDGTCSRDCGYYKSAKTEGCFDNKFCAEQPKCSGGLYDCRYVESDMEVCKSSIQSYRRYEFIQYESGLVHGKKSECSSWLSSVKSWNRWIFQECSYCLCLCDDQVVPSGRYFNLRPVIADVENNRVVTGLRFVKENSIFHLQIQEGRLLPLGVIEESTVQWKPLESYTIFDNNIKKNVDFHMLTYDQRAIDLDVVKADKDLVVTGLRFHVDGTHLQLEAQFSKVDFQSGYLINPKETSYWMNAGNKQHRERIPLMDPQIPSKSSLESIPFSGDNQFIEFTNTGFEQDAAQSTVPFIDIQDVVSDPPVPLSGIGIYYKGRDGYGGFLAPKLFTYDYTPYVTLPTWDES